MVKEEIFISIDIEADGPIPGPNSMLSIGSAAFDGSGKLIEVWSENLETLPGAKPDHKTKVDFWDKNPEAWVICRKDTKPADEVMKEYAVWLKFIEKKYNSRVIAVCAPAGFDFTFVYWYLIKFVGYSPFSFSCIDMKTYAMSLLHIPYSKSTKRNYPKNWLDKDVKHTHVALDDAIEQGNIFIKMRNYEKDLILSQCK